jgi:hypothetical protein
MSQNRAYKFDREELVEVQKEMFGAAYDRGVVKVSMQYTPEKVNWRKVPFV